MSGFKPGIEPETITLLTDFGEQDAYVAIMKGVMSRINPQVRMIDISHTIRQGDIRSAAFVADQAFSFFPVGTVHLIVVDPGVGTDRRALAVQAGSWYWVAPDNGVLSFIYKRFPDAVIVSLDQPEYWLDDQSSTFHGRDIFSPVAAHLSAGVSIDKVGTPVRNVEHGYSPGPDIRKSKIRGEIIYIDHFGNCVSNIPSRLLKSVAFIKFKKLTLRMLFTTYGEVESGTTLALVGSHKYLEIAVSNGNAAERLDVHMGDRVTVYLN